MQIREAKQQTNALPGEVSMDAHKYGLLFFETGLDENWQCVMLTSFSSAALLGTMCGCQH